jgi:lysophospholipase L1-like esterase
MKDGTYGDSHILIDTTSAINTLINGASIYTTDGIYDDVYITVNGSENTPSFGSAITCISRSPTGGSFGNLYAMFNGCTGSSINGTFMRAPSGSSAKDIHITVTDGTYTSIRAGNYDDNDAVYKSSFGSSYITLSGTAKATTIYGGGGIGAQTQTASADEIFDTSNVVVKDQATVTTIWSGYFNTKSTVSGSYNGNRRWNSSRIFVEGGSVGSIYTGAGNNSDSAGDVATYNTGYVYVSGGTVGTVNLGGRAGQSRVAARQSLTWTGGEITTIKAGYTSGDISVFYGGEITPDEIKLTSVLSTATTEYGHNFNVDKAIVAGRINFLPLRDQAGTDNFVFLDGVDGSNKNNGKTAALAVADIDTAVSILGPAGGTIVVSGNYAIGTLKNWPSATGGVVGAYLGKKEAVFTYEMPFEVTGGLTITGNYGGTDYNSTIDLISNGNTKFIIKGDTIIEDIFLTDGSEEAIDANGYNLTVDARVKIVTTIFLADGGTGDGSSAASPMGSLDAAFNALTLSEDCTIYIVGKYTQTSIFAPAKTGEGSVTITSYIADETDPVKAVFESPALRLSLSTDFIFDKINLNFTGLYYLVMCQYHNFTITEDVEITAPNVTNAAILNSISINSGYHTNSQAGGMIANSDCTITLNSGEKFFILPQGYQETVGTYTGTVTVNLGGDVKVERIHYTGSSAVITGGNTIYNISGDAEIESIQRGRENNINDGYLTINMSGGSVNTISVTASHFTGLTTFNDSTGKTSQREAAVIGGFDRVSGYFNTEFDISGLGLSLERTGANYITELLVDGISYYNTAGREASAFRINGNTASMLVPDDFTGVSAVQVISCDTTKATPVYSNNTWLLSPDGDGGYEAVRDELLSDALRAYGFAIRTTSETGEDGEERGQGLRLTATVKTAALEKTDGWQVTEYGLLAKKHSQESEMLYNSSDVALSTAYFKPFGDEEPTVDYFKIPPEGVTGRLSYFAAAITDIGSDDYETNYDFKPYMIISDGENETEIYGITYTRSIWAVANQCDEDEQALPFVEGILNMDRKIVITAVGDSNTDDRGEATSGRTSWPTQLRGLLEDEDYEVKNFGVSGSRVVVAETVSNSYIKEPRYFESLISDPDIVLIMLGTNDYHVGDAGTFDMDFTNLIKTYMNLPTKPKVYVMTAPPRYTTSTADGGAAHLALLDLVIARQKEVARSLGVDIIDIRNVDGLDVPYNASLGDNNVFITDNLHFTLKGYGLIARAVADEIKGN